MNSTALLIIDDEPQIRRLLRIAFEPEGHRIYEAESGHDGLIAVATRRPDIVILDLGLPDMAGIEVLQRLREWTTVPVLILSARQEPDDKVEALDAGADDYVTKPFDTAELLARVRVILRRRQPFDEPIFEAGPLRIDFTSRLVFIKGKQIEFTATEYALLRVLALHAGKVITQKHLLKTVWGPGQVEQAQYLRVFLSHIRRKFSEAGAPNMIQTEQGIGYRLFNRFPE